MFTDRHVWEQIFPSQVTRCAAATAAAEACRRFSFLTVLTLFRLLVRHA